MKLFHMYESATIYNENPKEDCAWIFIGNRSTSYKNPIVVNTKDSYFAGLSPNDSIHINYAHAVIFFVWDKDECNWETITPLGSTLFKRVEIAKRYLENKEFENE